MIPLWLLLILLLLSVKQRAHQGSSLLPAVKSCRSGTDFFLFCFLDLLKENKTKDESVSFVETTLSAGKQLI